MLNQENRLRFTHCDAAAASGLISSVRASEIDNNKQISFSWWLRKIFCGTRMK
jgi:uncharacterized protein YggL (DUF469 family)